MNKNAFAYFVLIWLLQAIFYNLIIFLENEYVRRNIYEKKLHYHLLYIVQVE